MIKFIKEFFEDREYSRLLKQNRNLIEQVALLETLLEYSNDPKHGGAMHSTTCAAVTGEMGRPCDCFKSHLKAYYEKENH